MKIIYYRKHNALYQKGIFISLKSLISIIIIITIFSYYFILPNFSSSISSYNIFFILLGLIGLIIFIFNSDEKSEVVIIPNKYKSIDTYNYLKKKLKKKKGEPENPNPKPIYLIGDNEFKSVIDFRNELISFYEECQKTIGELRKNRPEEMSIVKTDRLIRELAHKRKILKYLSERTD